MFSVPYTLEIGFQSWRCRSPTLPFPTPLAGVALSTHEQVPDWSINTPERRLCRTKASRSFSTRGRGDPGSRSRWPSWLKGLYHRSHVLVLIQKLSARANAWWRLGRQREVELFEQEFVIGLWMGVAA